MQIQPQFSGRSFRQHIPGLRKAGSPKPKAPAPKAAKSTTSDGPIRKGVKIVRNTLAGLALASAATSVGTLGVIHADNYAHEHGGAVLTSDSAQWKALGVFAMGLYGTPFFGVPAAAVAAGERLTRKKGDKPAKSEAASAPPAPSAPAQTAEVQETTPPDVQFSGKRLNKTAQIVGGSMLGLGALSAAGVAASTATVTADNLSNHQLLSWEQHQDIGESGLWAGMGALATVPVGGALFALGKRGAKAKADRTALENASKAD